MSAGPRRRVGDSALELPGLHFAPVASYHVGCMERWSFGPYVHAPAAEYDRRCLADPCFVVCAVSPDASR
jgi:hypothetical protein